MSNPKKSPCSKPKGNKRERTRVKLIEAATHIIKEKGYERTSLEEVARRAGMTRGAIYGNFKNREDLFLAVVETRWKPIIPPFRKGASFREQMRILGEAVVAAVPERRASAIGALSFRHYALTHETMRSRLVKGNKEIYKWAAKQGSQFIADSELPMPPEQFVRVIHGLIDGLLALRFLTPELISDDLIIAAFEAFGGGKERKIARGRSR